MIRADFCRSRRTGDPVLSQWVKARMAAQECRSFCRFGSIGWGATATCTFSACGVMPFLLPHHYRLLPPLAGPDRTLPCLHRRATAPFGPGPDPAPPPSICCAICAVGEGCGPEGLQGPIGCQSLPASLPALCHELGGITPHALKWLLPRRPAEDPGCVNGVDQGRSAPRGAASSRPSCGRHGSVQGLRVTLRRAGVVLGDP